MELGYNTESEASDFECVLPKEKSLLLLTSASHITRAKIIFFNYGLEIFPAPSDSRLKIYPAGNSSILFPTVRAIQYLNILIQEWIGLLCVKIRVMLGFSYLNVIDLEVFK